ncbi:MAG: hypothetical protein HQ542_12230, partial [Bacteroidia bacterium]|nr:hypothetical protein [Bacteroidia bacterium]
MEKILLWERGFFASSTYCKGGFVSVVKKTLTVQLTVIFLILTSVFISHAQITVVKWNFPNNPDDAIADGGIPANLGKTITTHGGVSSPAFDQPGFTSRCAAANLWTNGAYTKYWQIEFATEGYGDLTFESRQKSFTAGDFGPRDFNIQYRIGTSGTWTTFTTFQIPPGNHWFQIPQTALPVACDNQPSVYIRWLMSSNIPTQGSGLVIDDAYNRMDDVIIKSYCPIPLVSATPTSQTICPGSAISPIILTNTNGVSGTTFNWVRDNTSVLTGIPASGTSNPISGTLSST